MYFELSILNFIRENFASELMDALMKSITFFGNAGWFWIVVAIVLIIIPKTRKIGLTASVALIFSLLLCNVTLKPIIARIRPYDVAENISLIISAPKDYSFPSGHTSASFAASWAIFTYNKKWGALALAFAGLIAFSRLYLYVHFPTDVLGGLVLGIICATLAFLVIKFCYNRLEKHITK